MENSNQNQLSLKSILTIALVAGTLDGLAAFIFLAKLKFALTFQFISSAIFGMDAFKGGYPMVFLGILLHYFIAFLFTLFYVFAASKITVLNKNKVVVGILYGILVWSIMNLLIVPLTKAPKAPFDLEKAAVNCVILIFCIGLPIAILTARKMKAKYLGSFN